MMINPYKKMVVRNQPIKNVGWTSGDNICIYINIYICIFFEFLQGDAKRFLFWFLRGSHKYWYPSGLARAAPKTLGSEEKQ